MHTPDKRIQVMKGMKYLVLSLKVSEQPFSFVGVPQRSVENASIHAVSCSIAGPCQFSNREII